MNARSSHLLRTLVLALGLPGCVVYADGPKNAPPVIGYADAGCVWDDWQGTYILYFDVDASDTDGLAPVVNVSADVYDDGLGVYLDTYGLTPDVGPTWYSAWIYSTTKLDPNYGLYSADLVATDANGLQTLVTVPMWSCR